MLAMQYLQRSASLPPRNRSPTADDFSLMLIETKEHE